LVEILKNLLALRSVFKYQNGQSRAKKMFLKVPSERNLKELIIQKAMKILSFLLVCRFSTLDSHNLQIKL